MSIIIHKNTKILVQGFTGKIGSFHAEEMIKYGSNVVGGVTPGKGGMTHLNLPVFNTVKEAVDQTGASTSILFVPPTFAADSAMEAADAGIEQFIFVTSRGKSAIENHFDHSFELENNLLTKGKRDTDGIWSKVWYKKVEQSTSFNKYRNEYIVVPKKYSKIYDESLKYYDAMNKYSL